MDNIPELKFETAAAAAETKVQEAVQQAAPIYEAVPTLELTPKQPEPPVPEAGPDYSMLTEAEQKVVHDFAKKIDIRNPNLSLEYGAGAQKNVADFSDAALAAVSGASGVAPLAERLGQLASQPAFRGVREEIGRFLAFAACPNPDFCPVEPGAAPHA